MISTKKALIHLAIPKNGLGSKNSNGDGTVRKILTNICFLTAWLFCGSPLFADDLYFTNRTETLHEAPDSASAPVAELSKGTVINSVNNVRPVIDWIPGKPVTMFMVEVRTENGIAGWLPADSVSTGNSTVLPEKITGNNWTHGYYLDALRSGSRERIFEYEPFWRDSFYIGMIHRYGVEPIGNMVFSNIFVQIDEVSSNRYRFINSRIDEENGTYSFYAMCTEKSIGFAQPNFGGYFSEGETVRFTLRTDGDYLDVFVNGAKISTLIIRNDEIERQFGNLTGLWDDTPVDLSGIVWPRRADGSMDYPPPEGAILAFRVSHKTTDRLRVRENPDTSSAIVTTLDTDTQVQLLETGATETIGGITAPWVKVLSENGFTGWAFTGYLEPLAPEQENPETQNLDLVNPELENRETQNPESANQEPENVEAQNPDSENLKPENVETANPENGKGNFPVLMLVIAGSPILVSGIAVVLAKRRKGKAAKP